MFKILKYLKYKPNCPITNILKKNNNTKYLSYSYGNFIRNNKESTKKERIQAIQEFLESTR